MRDIPADVRKKLPVSDNGNHPTKWKESLGTAILRDAAKKASDIASGHNAVIAEARDEKQRVDLLASISDSQRATINAAGGVDAYLKWLDQRALEATDLAYDAGKWRDLAVDNTPDDTPDPDWLAGKTAAMDAERLQIERQIARDVPTVKALGNTPKRLTETGLTSLAEAVSANPYDPATITLGGVCAAWREQTKPVAPEQYEYPVKLFEELNGSLPIRQITVDHIRAFRDALAKMPPASGGKFGDKTMAEIIRIAERKGLKPLKASTAAKAFRCLKAMFTFAADDGYIELNVAAGIKPRRHKGSYTEAKRAQRRTFAPAEMAKLFEAAAVAPWRDKEENIWFLRLMTYTGARPEELAQLSARDVVSIGELPCLNLHDEGDNHIKNPSSIRRLPIHPELLRLGFLDFVNAADNRPYLFESLEPDGRGRRYGRMQDRLTRLINGKISNDPRLVPYSLRHTFRDAMELTEAPEFIIEGIMGHSNAEHKTGRGYGEKQVARMAEFLAKADPFDKRRVVAEFEAEEDDDA